VDEKNTPEDAQAERPSLPVVAEDRYVHSEVFDRLVKGPNDLPGLIAYGIYQIRKRAWIDACKSKHGLIPSVEELKSFSFGFQADALASLRDEAEGSMFRFAENVMNKRTEEMMQTAFDSRVIAEIEDLKKQIRHVGSYRHHIVGHLIGFAVLVFVAAFFGFALTHEPSLRDAVGWMFRFQ
jgi:hypothetical protein